MATPIVSFDLVMGRIHKVSRQMPAGRTDWRAFQLAFILYGCRRRRKFGGPCVEGKKGNYALPSLLGLPWVLYKDGFMKI